MTDIWDRLTEGLLNAGNKSPCLLCVLFFGNCTHEFLGYGKES